MDTKALRQKILDLAIRGKLVPQDPNDEPASILLERIREEKAQMFKEGKLKKKDIKNDSIIYVGEDNLHYEKFTDGSVKCIEDEIPFNVPEGWAWSKINTIAFVTKLAGFEYTKKIAPNLCENGIPLFKGKNVQNSKIIYEFESFIPESVSDELLRSQINKKCILTPYVGTIGNIGIHNRPGKYHLGSNVGKIELYNDNVILLEEYIVSYLQSVFGYHQLTKHMKATAQASISIEAIRDVYIPIPPANEQLRMWEALSKALSLIECIENTELDICDLISKSKSKILNLAIRGKLVLQDSNDEPASVLLDRIRAEKEELIKQGKIKRNKKDSVIFKGEDNSYYEKINNNIEKISDEIPFELPVNWVWCRVAEVIELFSGQDLTPDRYSDIPQGIPYITGASNLEKGHIIINRWTSSATTHATIGDLLLTVKGSGVGKMAICDIEDAHIARQIMALRCRNGIVHEYLQIVISAFLTEIIDQANGIIPGIRRKVVLNTLFPLPPSSEQLRISAKVKHTISELQMIEKSLS